jgi:hypothetical protein
MSVMMFAPISAALFGQHNLYDIASGEAGICPMCAWDHASIERHRHAAPAGRDLLGGQQRVERGDREWLVLSIDPNRCRT